MFYTVLSHQSLRHISHQMAPMRRDSHWRGGERILGVSSTPFLVNIRTRDVTAIGADFRPPPYVVTSYNGCVPALVTDVTTRFRARAREDL